MPAWVDSLTVWHAAVAVLIAVPALWLWSVLGRRKHEALARQRHRVRELADAIAPATGAEGNRVECLLARDGSDTLRALREGIAGARRRISVGTYILAHDAVGRELVALLAARAREGIEVRLLIDAIGSRTLPWFALRRLHATGGQVAWFNPVFSLRGKGSANWRNHRKLAVFDGTVAIIGGQNLGGQYIGSNPSRRRFRDASFRISGPAANHIEHIFLTDWCQATGTEPESLRATLLEEAPPVGMERAQVIDSGPDAEGDLLWKELLRMVEGAREGIDIVTPYFIPDAELLAALTRAARDGRRVRVIVPRRSDHRLTDFARRPALRVLAEAGAEIYLYSPGVLHTKLVLVDRSQALIGSANIDMRSFFLNYEIGAMVSRSPACAEIAEHIESLAAESRQLSPRVIARAQRWHGRGLERLAKLIEPLL
ncbi:MAG: phospholipase D-like domain-containing protein [Opitutales bacterium]|jgi:cardiolipin synthase